MPNGTDNSQRTLAIVVVVCTTVVVAMLAVTNKRLAEVTAATTRVANDTMELASATRVHYEPQTFNINMRDQSLKYKDGHGIPACDANVREFVNGDQKQLHDLAREGWYVLSVSTHEVTGNQTNFETGRLKSESETGYRTCSTQGLLYILRRDLGPLAAEEASSEPTPPPEAP